MTTPRQYVDGFPYCAIGDTEGFQIRDCMIYRLRDQQSLESWYLNDPSPPDFPDAWLRQFWHDLYLAPTFELRADQWSSDYYSLIDGQVMRWRDDRKEGSNYIERSQPVADFLDHPATMPEVKDWLAQILGLH